MLRTLLASAALLACALPARAQNSYTSTRDTLRFRETTQMRMTLTMPQASRLFGIEREICKNVVERLVTSSYLKWTDSGGFTRASR